MIGSGYRKVRGLLTSGRDERLREKVREKSERLKKLRTRLKEKDREIEALKARSSGTSGTGTPVFFLVGRAKSGTSWLMRTLDSHPEILCRGEGRLFGKDYKSESIKNMDSKTIQPSSLYRAILDAEYLDAWVSRSVWSRDDDKDEHLDNLTRLAVEYFLTRKLAESGKRIVGDKTPLLGGDVLREIGTIYPNSRVIHIIRDGRDVAVSSIHHVWNHAVQEGGSYGVDTESLEKRDRYRSDPTAFADSGESIFVEGQAADIAKNWADMVERARNDGAKLLDSRYAEVRYEDLLARPVEEVGRLLRFLGAAADGETATRCVESASFERWSKGRERGREDSRAFLRKGVAGDWKNVFTENDRRAFEEAAGGLLMDLGYESGGGR